jgi:hypothetical protein
MKLYWRPQTRSSRVEWVLAAMLAWAGRQGHLEAFPGLRRYRDRLLDRPTARRLFAEAPPC